MSDILIVNKHGKFHAIPERLLDTVARQGGRRATPAEKVAYESGQGQIDASAPATAVSAAAAAPWADYDSLNVDQVVARLRGATPDMIARVHAYEQQAKARKGVLEATNQ